MTPFQEDVYLGEILRQAAYADAVLVRVNAMLQPKAERADFFREIQNLVRHASAISMLLWPPPGRPKTRARASARGEHLRGALGIEDGHPLKERTLRDHLEHYDERVDAWAHESPQQLMVREMFGSREDVAGVRDSDIMLHYDPNAKRLVFRGESFDVEAIIAGIGDVATRAKQRIEDLRESRRAARAT